MPVYAVTNWTIEVCPERDDESACAACDCPRPGVFQVTIGGGCVLLCCSCLTRLRATIERHSANLDRKVGG